MGPALFEQAVDKAKVKMGLVELVPPKLVKDFHHFYVGGAGEYFMMRAAVGDKSRSRLIV